MIQVDDYIVIVDLLTEAIVSSNGIESQFDILLERSNDLEEDLDSVRISQGSRGEVLRSDIFFRSISEKLVTAGNFESVEKRSLENIIQPLQEHISTHYGNIDDFLSNNGIKVQSEFASMSEDVGYPIDPSNIVS